MVTIDFIERLGNNMFQIAACYGIADKWKVEPQFPKFKYFNLPKLTKPILNEFAFFDPNNPYKEIPYKPNCKLIGYFQRHEYFDHIRHKLINEVFNVPFDFQPNTIAVHVRRGDFLKDPINFPIQPDSYYLNSLIEIGYKDRKIFFLSDDIKYCKEHFDHLPNVYFREGFDPLEDIYFGANCEHVVMSNSTFSFWIAYLNRNPKKKVYFPLNWFAPHSGRNGYEICPKEWIGK